MSNLQTGRMVQYLATDAERPMHVGDPQAAIITDWDANTSKASLAVFLRGTNYPVAKANVVEGTAPGTFQQLASASGATAKK